MYLRPGNLVRHKSGGPIMMIDDAVSLEEGPGFVDDPYHQCAWVEAGTKRFGTFRASQLQWVHVDGTPRNRDEEQG
jgi:uncharacterized protein YodC (DUF2158 family)